MNRHDLYDEEPWGRVIVQGLWFLLAAVSGIALAFVGAMAGAS